MAKVTFKTGSGSLIASATYQVAGPTSLLNSPYKKPTSLPPYAIITDIKFNYTLNNEGSQINSISVVKSECDGKDTLGNGLITTYSYKDVPIYNSYDYSGEDISLLSKLKHKSGEYVFILNGKNVGNENTKTKVIGEIRNFSTELTRSNLASELGYSYSYDFVFTPPKLIFVSKLKDGTLISNNYFNATEYLIEKADKDSISLINVFKEDYSKKYRFVESASRGNSKTSNSISTSYNKDWLYAESSYVDVVYDKVYSIKLKIDDSREETHYFDSIGKWDFSSYKTVQTGNFTIPNPKRTGYVFAGWKNLKTNAIMGSLSIDISGTEDLEYEALWTLGTYKTSFTTKWYSALDTSESKILTSDANICKLNINHEGEAYSSGPIMINYLDSYNFTIGNVDSYKYEFDSIEVYYNSNIKSYKDVYDKSNSFSEAQQMGSKDGAKLEEDTTIEYVIIFKKLAYPLSVSCTVKNSAGQLLQTQEDKSYYLLEINGEEFNINNKYLYEDDIIIQITPNINYELTQWGGIGFNSAQEPVITPTFGSTTIINVKTRNKISIEIKENDLNISTLKDIEATNSKVTEVTDSILTKLIDKFIDVDIAYRQIGSHAFCNCSNLKTLYIQKCDIIGENSFEKCTNLVSFTLPSRYLKGRREIHAYAFLDCANLSTLIIPGDDIVALTNPNAFDGTPIGNGQGYIYVNNVNAYKNDQNWASFAKQFRSIDKTTSEGLKYYNYLCKGDVSI